MATLKIIDRKDKFLVEVGGSKVPYVTTYELVRKPSGSVLLHLALAMSNVEVEVESDNIEYIEKIRRTQCLKQPKLPCIHIARKPRTTWKA